MTGRLSLYLQLTRLNRPIGIYVLLWQTLWALWIAAEGTPDWHLIVIFTLGVVLMRSAGCVVNDLADRHLDGHVKRTKARPLATGQVSVREALAVTTVLVLLSFGLVLLLNRSAFLWSIGALVLAAIYPFMKRHTHWPQLFLGLAFSWAIPIAFAAQGQAVNTLTWLLFISAICWIIAYDTQYAMVDRDDDLKIGIRSTAIFFGEYDRLAIGGFQAAFIVGMLLVGETTDSGLIYYFGLLGAAAVFLYQAQLTRSRERGPCFQAFLSNHWAGLAVFAGVLADRSLLPLL